MSRAADHRRLLRGTPQARFTALRSLIDRLAQAAVEGRPTSTAFRFDRRSLDALPLRVQGLHRDVAAVYGEDHVTDSEYFCDVLTQSASARQYLAPGIAS